MIASPSGREQSIFAESQAGDRAYHVVAERDLYGLGGSTQIANDVANKFLRIGASPSVPMSMKLQMEDFAPPNGAPKYAAPASAYQVSSEYSIITVAANNGWLDGDRARGAEQRVAQRSRDAISA